MTEINPAAIRTQFARNATPPREQMQDAAQFLDTVKRTGAVAPNMVAQGERLLKTLDERTEAYSFHAAILAGQEAASDTDLDSRLKEIVDGVEQAEKMSRKLRETLGSAIRP